MIRDYEYIQARDELLIKAALETKDDILIGVHSVIFANTYCHLSQIIESLTTEELYRITNWFDSPVQDAQRKFAFIVTMMLIAEGSTWKDEFELRMYLARAIDLFRAELEIRMMRQQQDEPNERFENMCKQFHQQLSLVDYEKIKIKS